jgi:hypothetical protein
MSKPTLLVVTLLVLWLIVLVPMIFRRVDDSAPARSVRRYGRSMRLLNRRHANASVLASGYDGGYRGGIANFVGPRISGPRDELFVPGGSGSGRRAGSRDVAGRSPAVAGQEGQMYRAEMSDARRQMMARRRRSLTVLIVGSVLSLLLAFVVGGTLLALLTTMFCLGLGGYVFFLRSQALRDRERRSWREERALERTPHYEDHAVAEEYFDEVPDTMVRIDDDSIELHNLDTMDLTGVYNEADYQDLRERRAS